MVCSWVTFSASFLHHLVQTGSIPWKTSWAYHVQGYSHFIRENLSYQLFLRLASTLVSMSRSSGENALKILRTPFIYLREYSRQHLKSYCGLHKVLQPHYWFDLYPPVISYFENFLASWKHWKCEILKLYFPAQCILGPSICAVNSAYNYSSSFFSSSLSSHILLHITCFKFNWPPSTLQMEILSQIHNCMKHTFYPPNCWWWQYCQSVTTMYYGSPLLGASSSILSGLPDSPSILLAVTIASHQTLRPKANAT